MPESREHRRLDAALDAWRERTRDLVAPAGFADEVERAVRSPGMAAAVISIGRPVLMAAAVAAAALIFAATSAVGTLEASIANYALSGGP